MGTRSRTAESIIAQIASTAHGVVARTELLEAGLTEKQIAGRVRRGALIPEYPGIYRVGHRAPSRDALYLAAVKAGGDGALLWRRAGGHLLRILKSPTPPAPEVLTRTERRARGFTRTRHIDPGDITEVNGIPVTTVPRTLVDLAAILTEDELARACHEAGVLYRTTPAHVQAVLDRRPNAKGATILKAVMTGDVKVLLSKLESGFNRRLEEAGLPLPQTNRVASKRRVDCRWPDHKLTVELDSYQFHNSRQAWELDRQREREARLRGDEFRRYTYADVFEDPTYMLAELRELLA